MREKSKHPINYIRLHLRESIVVATIVAITAVFAVASGRNNTNTSLPEKTRNKNLPNLGLKVSDTQHLGIDQHTGQVRPLSQEEATRLAAGLKHSLNRSSEGLKHVHHEDGSVSVDLEDRFQSVTVARINQDGTTVTSCVDNPRAAAAFFDIDPKLMQTDGDQGAGQPKLPR